jgi:hypothetical protein
MPESPRVNEVGQDREAATVERLTNVMWRDPPSTWRVARIEELRKRNGLGGPQLLSFERKPSTKRDA